MVGDKPGLSKEFKPEIQADLKEPIKTLATSIFELAKSEKIAATAILSYVSEYWDNDKTDIENLEYITEKVEQLKTEINQFNSSKKRAYSNIKESSFCILLSMIAFFPLFPDKKNALQYTAYRLLADNSISNADYFGMASLLTFCSVVAAGGGSYLLGRGTVRLINAKNPLKAETQPIGGNNIPDAISEEIVNQLRERISRYNLSAHKSIPVPALPDASP